MKRIFTIFAVMLVMVAMMVATAAPAFANHKSGPGLLPSQCEVDLNQGHACTVNV